MAEGRGEVVRLAAAEMTLRRAFLGWQCRLRQLAVRQHGGRPSAGMRPLLEVAGQKVGAITVVVSPLEPAAATTQFRFMVKRTQDPLERLEAALQHLSAAYYQSPDSFSDQMTALFAPDARLPRQLAGRTDCVLGFAQFNQAWRLPCSASLLAPDAPAWQATYWHNALFNEHLPGGVQILAFTPDWAEAEAEPSPI